MPIRVLAIDWSGAKERAGQKIWLAEAAAGTLSRVENGRDRHGILDHLLDESRRSGRLIVGLDFAFSLPSWFLAQRQVVDGPGLWTQVTSSAEEWLAACPPPFWGRPRKPCPRDSCQFRRTEQDVGVTAGIRPKSVFQIGGAGAVGTESLRGMPILLRLRDAGFAVWPFDDVHLPLVVEIYPRLLTRAVNKSRRDSRATSFDELRRQHVKLVKFRGPFVWHRHENEDELFLVHKGRFTMELRDRTVPVEEGEFIIVPRNTEHRPMADGEAHVLLFEPATTLNTGDVQNELTVREPERI